MKGIKRKDDRKLESERMLQKRKKIGEHPRLVGKLNIDVSK